MAPVTKTAVVSQTCAIDTAGAFAGFALQTLTQQEGIKEMLEKTQTVLKSAMKGIEESNGCNSSNNAEINLDNFSDESKSMGKKIGDAIRTLEKAHPKEEERLVELKKAYEVLVDLRDRNAEQMIKSKVTKNITKVCQCFSTIHTYEETEAVVLVEGLRAVAADRTEEQTQAVKQVVDIYVEHIASLEASVADAEAELRKLEVCQANLKKVTSAISAISDARRSMQDQVVNILSGCSAMALSNLDGDAKKGLQNELSSVVTLLDGVTASAQEGLEKAAAKKEAASSSLESQKESLQEKKQSLGGLKDESKALKASVQEANSSLKRAREESKEILAKGCLKDTQYWKDVSDSFSELNAAGQATAGRSAKKLKVVHEAAVKVEMADLDLEMLRKKPETRSEEEVANLEKVKSAFAQKYEEFLAKSTAAETESEALLKPAKDASQACSEKASAHDDVLQKAKDDIAAGEKAVTKATARVEELSKMCSRAKQHVSEASAHHEALVKLATME